MPARTWDDMGPAEMRQYCNAAYAARKSGRQGTAANAMLHRAMQAHEDVEPHMSARAYI
jgi:hypothetical protein